MLPGDAVLTAKTSSFRLRDSLLFILFFIASMYNQEIDVRIFQTSILEVKLLNP